MCACFGDEFSGANNKIVLVKVRRANLDPSVLGLGQHLTPPNRGDTEGDAEGGSRNSRSEAQVEKSDFVEEYRIDPNDGYGYTIESFVAEYGGTSEWEAAAPAVESTVKMSFFAVPATSTSAGGGAAATTTTEEELRIDPSDGRPYRKQAFLDEYGGTAEWEDAAVVSAPILPSEDLSELPAFPSSAIVNKEHPPPPKSQRRKSGFYRAEMPVS